MAQRTTMAETSRVEEREAGLTREIFVAPVSRFPIVAETILGGRVTSLILVIPFFEEARVIGTPLPWAVTAGVLWVTPIDLVLGAAMGILLAVIFATDPKAVDRAVLMVIFPQMFFSGAPIPVGQSVGDLAVWCARCRRPTGST